LKPSAVLVVSAHWETKGTFVTAMEKPETIHDSVVSKELYSSISCTSNPKLAKEIKETVDKTEVGLDTTGDSIMARGLL
jgi:4,5-DOPA dioxygenase extradiol